MSQSSLLSKKELHSLIDQYFTYSPDVSIKPKLIDPVINVFNNDPTDFPFYSDHGKKFEFFLTIDTDKENQKKCIKTLLSLHANHITFTDEYKNIRKIRDIKTNVEIICNLQELRLYFGGQVFQRAFKRLLQGIYDPAAREAYKKEKQLKEKQRLAAEAQKKKAAQVSSSSSSESSSDDSESDSDSDSSSSSSSSSDSDSDSSSDSDDDHDISRLLSANSKRQKGNDANPDSQEMVQLDPVTGKATKKAPIDPNRRYIIFVGNLNYETRKEDLERLFKQCNVKSVRLLSSKTTQQSKGCAFVEFTSGEDVHHAIGYHNSEFMGRKIVCELTVGGGGNSKKRREKIDKKREGLVQERQVRKKKDAARNAENYRIQQEERAREQQHNYH